MMQGLHHQQQQLAALLSVALAKDDSPSLAGATPSTSTSVSSASSAAPPITTKITSSNADESARLSAINSLHRAILYPPNSILVSHSASFLSQGFSQLLSDKSHTVRRAAAVSYGALCSVLCSIPIGTNGRPNHLLLGSLVDRFIDWALPLLTNVAARDGAMELAVESLHEFLSVGDVVGTERYALPILKACQELLEDERTSFSLLQRLLGILTLISLKFYRFFQPHFADIVDLLLGWVLVPNLAEADRRVILDSFLEFQKHWVANLQFSLGLLSKFLGDMEVLLQDDSQGTPPQFRRLLALLSCFSTVLKSTASGLLEMNFLEQISEPLSKLHPRLLQCLSMIGKKFGWSKWIEDLWKCLTLLAEILGERFSTLYPLVVDILFQSLDQRRTNHFGAEKVTSFQIHGVLKTNLQLLSLQKLGLHPASVHKILEFDSPVSQLRLHPNHLVTGSSAATYIFLLQHGNADVVQQATSALSEELELLKGLLNRTNSFINEVDSATDDSSFSKFELLSLMKFDLKVLLTCVSIVSDKKLTGHPEIAALYLKRLKKLTSFVLEKLNPFDLAILNCVELQANIIGMLERLTSIEFWSWCSIKNQTSGTTSLDVVSEATGYASGPRDDYSAFVAELLGKYNLIIIKALHYGSPLALKMAVLGWIERFCKVLVIFENSDLKMSFGEAFCCYNAVGNIVSAVFDAASDKEPKVRLAVASVLELLLKARLIDAMCFYPMVEIVLEKLGDSDADVKMAFVTLLSNVLPISVYACGVFDYSLSIMCKPRMLASGNSSNLHWKQVFALRQLKKQLHSQQLVTILSYISQRWKAPLSCWIHRLSHASRNIKDSTVGQLEDPHNSASGILWLDRTMDEDILQRMCLVNNLAGAWWAIHEAARYCITTRLRTNLGGPSQTFAALERMLLDVAHVLQLDVEQSDGNLGIVGSSGAHLLPMRLLLEFVESLKKNVYNAYEGSAILPPATRQSLLFFRANKKVCEEWFSRICEPMMNAGLALQCHDATIQYCTYRLLEIKSLFASALKEKSRSHTPENLHNIKDKFSGDIFKVLRHMALALCRSHDSEALIGLQQWVSVTFPTLLADDNNQSAGYNGISGPLTWISGLIFQSKCQYEKAAAYFSHLLQNEESLSSMGSDGVQFTIARIIESYTAVSDWKSLETWLSELQMLRSKHAGKSYSGALTTAGNEVNAIYGLARFDEGDFQAAWSFLDLTPKSSCELTLDPKLALQRSEQMLLQAMMLSAEGKEDKVTHEIQKAESMLDEILSILPLDGIANAAPYATQLHCIFAFQEGQKLKGGQAKPKQHQSLLISYIDSVQSPMSMVRQDCNPWLKVLRVHQNMFPASPFTLNLSMSLLRLARKQENFMLANRLNNHLRDNIMKCSESRYHNIFMLRLQYEELVLKYAENKIEDAFAHIWSFLHPYVFTPEPVGSSSEEGIVKAKACLKLAKWLRLDYPDLSLDSIALKMIADFKVNDASVCCISERVSGDSNSETSAGSAIEEFVGTATKLSTQLCPVMGKAWISYASWCFNQARDSLFNPRETVLRSCSFSRVLLPEVLPERFKLTEDEMASVQLLIFGVFQNEGTSLDGKGKEGKFSLDSHSGGSNAANALLQQVISMIETTAGLPGAENSSGEPLSLTLASQLQNFILSTNTILEESKLSIVVDDLVKIWWCLRKRRVSLFGHAANGFMKYLTCSSAKSSDAQSAGSKCELLKQKSSSYTLRASLYALHIILDYGVELKDIIEPSLSMLPLLPWQELTPQLFARLSSHPEQVVRKQLEGLLMMLAKLSPWSIVYPALVDVNASEDKPSEEIQHILGSLRELYPRLIQDVELMINELGNVTVLWEELWLSTLQDLHADVMRRINVLKEEATRIAENATLSLNEKKKINGAKYSAMMAPIIVALERRLASTSRKPETPHEAWFCEEYRERLKLAISKFKTPPASAASLGDLWRPFEDIASSLASYQRKSCITLGEVAPRLASLSSSDVPMPGLEKQVSISDSQKDLGTTQGIITIASFCEEVTILSTKTRPKKLVMLGSDGQKYTYLLKGREDLRLDARIMQLLQAINGFLRASSATHKDLVSVRYYSVTPVSGRAGLIQWVDNVISIYSVFKSWQNRMQQAQLSAVNAGTTRGSGPPPIPRPSDMFYGKIIPALKEKGIRRVISRRDWPHDVKRKVLLDLMKEVPRQLLHQELWCASEGFKAFSSKLKRYSGSVAAMSIVGHVLGLGDRHLDNILVDFCSGDVVHIDYNVCFDKGQRLKIPEIVPFRLTQIIEAALGLTGVEGTFRTSCESVLSVLKKNKDIILMLLEVFIWDPLVEWTRGDFHDDAAIGGEERKGMELAVSLSLFASRVQEIRVPLQEHHDLLLAALPTVESALERFADVLNRYELASALFYQADQERSNYVMHETSAKSKVADASSTLEKTRGSFEFHAREFSSMKSVITEKAQEAATWIEKHNKILDALRTNLLPETNASLKLDTTADNLSLTSAVIVAGIPLTIVPEPTQVQCQDIDREVFQLIVDLDHGLSSVLNGIQSYTFALQRILPLNYMTTSMVHGWTQLLQLAANAHSSDVVALARRQAAELCTRLHVDNLDSAKHRHFELCCQVEKYAEEVKRVDEESAELANSIGHETESKAKERLMGAVIKYIHSAGLVVRKDDASSSNQVGQLKHNATKLSVDLEDKKEKVASILNLALSSMYDEVKHKIPGVFNASGNPDDAFGTTFSGFEEQVEKCVLVAGFFGELWQFFGVEFPGSYIDAEHERNGISIFQRTLIFSKFLVEQMTEVVLLEVMRSAVSLNSEVMDAFGSTSQIRGSIDTALEQLLEVELEKASLNELEKNYFVKVGFITEQQLALEEAAMKGRDHLSWEEAEELASQEEACRAQLDQLHQAWNQRESRSSSLLKREIDIRNSLISSEWQFKSLTAVEDAINPQVSGSRVLLSMLANPFTDLETVDKGLLVFSESVASYTDNLTDLANLASSGYSISEYIWKFGGLSSSQCFFVWKVCIVDSILDSCIHDVASLMDQNLGFDQLFNVVKKKLQVQLEDHVGRYLKERVASTFLVWLDKEIQHLKQLTEGQKELSSEQARKDTASVRKVQFMLEEYCNAHETARAARSAASLMKKQANELKDALCKASLEIVQLEWMYDALTPSQKSKRVFDTFLDSGDDLYSIILNLSRPKLLEGMQSAITNISRSIDSLQTCERNSITVEGQLERAMSWACGGPNSNSVANASSKASGIPHEFHDHLARRRKLLWEAKEKATATVDICMSILEFEASRDGMFQIPGQSHPPQTGDDGRAWQQAYFNALTQLEITYHSFTRAEQEWKLSQSNMEAASSLLFLASNELNNASHKAKSASGELQNTVLAMRDCAYEASIALSSFSRVSRGHTALTSESGTMLEEVLAITEDLHDVHTSGKEASAVHYTLTEELSKANAILLPLEAILSKDVAAMTDAIAREKETKLEVSPIHGQAIYQSYYLRIRETIQAFKLSAPSLASSVKGLYSILTSLARTASLHAGNLHKALEELAESQEVKTPEINLSRPDIDSDADQFDEKGTEQLSNSETETAEDFISETEFTVQDKGWISPPDSICSNSSGSDVISVDASVADSFDNVGENPQGSHNVMETGHLDYAPSSQMDNQVVFHSSELIPKHEMIIQGEDQVRDDDYQLSERLKSTILPVNDPITIPTETSQPLSQDSSGKLDGKGEEVSSSNRDKIQDGNHETAHPNSHSRSRVARGKNPYAVSVLRRVEMKIDGRDIAENREINVQEQVDYLIKQAMSIDNLCNMYEGWTPWI
ncbi:Serine/threonine-protein kinase SMG1 [Linum perenne]